MKFLNLEEEVFLRVWNEWLEAMKKPPGKRGRQKWNLVSKSKLNKVWKSFAKYGSVRNEDDLEDILSDVTTNVAKIAVNTTLLGHTQDSPERYVQEMLERGDRDVPDAADIGKIIEELVDSDFATDDKGAWRLSDYGMDKMRNYSIEALAAETPEEKIVAVDKILNVVHQRSDLASWFVEGGSNSLSELSETPMKTNNPDVDPWARDADHFYDRMYTTVAQHNLRRFTWAENKDFIVQSMESFLRNTRKRAKETGSQNDINQATGIERFLADIKKAKSFEELRRSDGKRWVAAEKRWTDANPPQDIRAEVLATLVAIQEAEARHDLDARNGLAAALFNQKGLRNFKTQEGRVETWWDRKSRNWVTQWFDLKDHQVDSDYSGEKLGASLSHAWMLMRMMISKH